MDGSPKRRKVGGDDLISASPLVIPSSSGTQDNDSDIMTTSYTTSAGITVDLSTSGFVLSSYLQAFGLDPAQFRQESVWNEIPIAQAMQRKRPLSPTSSNLQDPTAIGAAVGQTSLFSCTITLPPLCPIRSVSSPGIGHKNKATAKKHAQLRCVIMLLERGDIGPDLKPNTLRIPRAKSPPSSSQNPRTAGRPQDVGQYDYKRAQHVHKQASSTMPGMRSTPTMLPLSSFGGQDKHRQERLASIHASLRDKLPINPISSKSVIPGMAEYDYLANAGFWSTLPTFQPDKLYPTLIHLKLGEPYQYVNDKCRIMCLITSRPLPDFENGQHTVDATMTEVGSERKTIPASVDVIQGKKMLEWPEGKLEQAIAYTTRLMRAQLNKGVRPDLANLKWLIVPVNREYNRPSKISGPINLKRRDIDWDEVERGNGPIWTPFTFEDPDALAKEAVDAMTSVKHEYCKRSFVKCIRTDLNPFSPLPSEPDKRIADTAPNYQEPIIAEQCIIEAEPVLTLRRGGVIASVIPPKVNGVPQESSLLMPQLVQRHCISASAYRTTSILPSVLLALDDLLIAKDLSDKVFDGALVYHQAQTALSCPVSHNGAPHKSYQRLEMLGDTLLKFLSGVFLLYRTQSDEIDWDELHEIKQLMVSNRALGLRVLEAGVIPYIRGPSQKYNNWLPMGWQMEEDPHKHQETAEDQAPADKEDEVEENQRMKKVKTSDDVSPKKALKATAEPFIPSKPIAKADFGEYSLDQMYKDGIHPYQSRVATPSLEVQSSPKQRLGDKTIADVCEALIAAAYFSFGAGIDGAIKAMHCLNLPIEGMTNWAEVVARSSELEGPKPSNVRVKPATLLDYQFRNPDYAHDVMNIGSEHKTNFLKFKILGDAVLDYFIIEELYHQYPQAGPGQLTVMRHSRHGDACLASFCVVSGLVNQVVNIPVAVITEINKFKQSIDSARRIADKAVDDSDRWEFWAEILPLHYFGEVMNALFGAILVDSHYDIKAVKKVYDTHFKPFLDRYCIGPTERSLHPRVVWSEMIFKRGCTHWELTKESQRSLEVPFTSRVIVHGRVLGYGEGDTQVIAMRKACENAVKKVKMGNPLDTVCSCPRKRGKSGTSAVKR